MFDFETYLKKAIETCQPRCFSEDYLELGLISEIGEIAGKLKRVIRDGDEIDKDDMAKEIGDVLWYISVLSRFRGEEINIKIVKSKIHDSSIYFQISILSLITSQYFRDCGMIVVEDILSCLCGLAKSLGFTLQEIADINNKKLEDRRNRGKINGNGDNR